MNVLKDWIETSGESILNKGRLTPPQVQKILNWADVGSVRQLRFLGTGAMGWPYRFGDKVLKITTDKSEAIAAAQLVNLDHPNIYKVFKVGKMTAPKDQYYDDDSYKELYLIVCEYLPIKGDIWGREINRFKNYYNNNKDTKKLVRKWNSLFVQEQREALTQIAGFSVGTDLFRVISQIYSAVSFLVNHGIQFYDFHDQNVMFRDKTTPVLIDLGVSKTKNKTGQIDIVENKIIQKLLFLVKNNTTEARKFAKKLSLNELKTVSKMLNEYNDETHWQQVLAPSFDKPEMGTYYKTRQAAASFPYVSIGDWSDEDIIRVEKKLGGEDEAEPYFEYPFKGFKGGGEAAERQFINPEAGGGAVGSVQIPSKATGGKHTQDMPAGMNSPGWASAPREYGGEKKSDEKDYIKDFLTKLYDDDSD